MTIEEEFLRSRNIITKDSTEFDMEAFKNFVAANGKDVALGYILALADVKASLEEVLYPRYAPERHTAATPNRVRTQTRKFYSHLYEILDTIKSTDAGSDNLLVRDSEYNDGSKGPS